MSSVSRRRQDGVRTGIGMGRGSYLRSHSFGRRDRSLDRQDSHLIRLEKGNPGVERLDVWIRVPGGKTKLPGDSADNRACGKA